MRVWLVHHGEAVGPDIDVRRPLSPKGQAAVEKLARAAASRGVRPAIVWHSGKLRARQTAEAFWRACNALATFSATRDLQPGDPPSWMCDRLAAETQDLLIAGHFPHLPRLLSLLTTNDDLAGDFPKHGMVSLERIGDVETWSEKWRLVEGDLDS